MLAEYARARLTDDVIRAAATYGPMLSRTSKPAEQFSLKRMLLAMATERGLTDGAEREVCTEAAREMQRNFDSHRCIVPWSVLAQRDLTSLNTGSLLIDTTVGSVSDALRPFSVAASAGLTMLTGLRSNIATPRIDGDLTGSWLATDGTSAIAPSDPALGLVSISPKTWGGIVPFSHTFARQFNAESFLRQQLLRTAGRALDQAVMAGSGNAGQPLGILNTSNVPSTSGASFALATSAAMRKAVAAAGADDAAVTWIASPATRETLSQRETVADTGIMIWSADKIDNRSAFVTPDCPDDVLICADLSKILLGVWGVGPEIQLNPFSDFARGSLAVRLLLMVDVAVLQLDAIMLATGVS